MSPTASPLEPAQTEPAWVTGGCHRFFDAAAETPRRLCAVGTGPAHPDRIAAAETAVARARTELGRRVEVSIEDYVRIEGASSQALERRQLTHQLSSTQLESLRVDAIWHGPDGRPHALVSIPTPRIP